MSSTHNLQQMCFSLKILGKTSSSEATTPATSGESPHPGSLSVSDEYANAVKTESYELFRNRVHRFSGHAIEENGQTSDHSIVRSNGFLEELLSPDQESVNAIIQSKNLSKNPALFKLVFDFFNNSEDSCKGCGALQNSIDSARQSYNKIETILGVMPTAGEFSEEQCHWIIEEFRLFVDAENPFAQPFSENFHHCFRDLFKQTELSRNLAGAEPKWVKKFMAVYAVCLDRVSPAVLIGGLVIVAILALLAIVGGPDAACFPVDFARKRMRLRKEYKKQLDATGRGCYVLSNHADTMSRLVARLHQDVEHTKTRMKFSLQRKYDRHAVEEVVRVLKKNDGKFTEQLDDLEEDVCLCVMNINRARRLLFQQIHEV